VCVSLGDQAVNIDKVCLYLVSDVVHLVFLRHEVAGPTRDLEVEGSTG